jgi:hypothetical protein
VSVSPEQTMVVVNLADFDFEFTKHGIYTCPSEADGFRPSYKHYPAKYAGIYINKGAPFVAEVDALVRLPSEGNGIVVWKFVDKQDESLVEEAIRRRHEAVFERTGRVVNQTPCHVFLFGTKRRTDFAYDIPGGLQGSRQYFDLSLLPIDGIDSLASELRNTTWSGLPKLRV